MRSAWIRISCLILCITAPLTGAMAAASKEESRVIASTAILDEWQQISDLAIPDRLLQRAQGIAVFPSVIKGAFIFGARYGTGVLVVRDSNGNWSSPSFLTLAGGNFGFQAGLQSTDIILVFTTRRGIEGLSGGKVTVGVDLAGAVGPVGRQVSGATDLGFSAEVYSYSRAKGLFAGVALDGSSMSIDHGANAKFYGQEGLLASDIFAGKITRAPDSAKAFTVAVDRMVRGEAAGATPASAPAASRAPATSPASGSRPEEKGLESGGAATFPLDPAK